MAPSRRRIHPRARESKNLGMRTSRRLRFDTLSISGSFSTWCGLVRRVSRIYVCHKQGHANSVTQNHALGAVECVGARDDDLIAGRQAAQDFDLGDAGGAQLHSMALRDIAADEVGKTAAFLIHEGAAIDHQYGVAPIDEDANRQPLTLSQTGGLF